MEKLYIVMPVYNEASNIRQTVADWYPITEFGQDSRLLLIDDGSKDDSFKIMQELTEEYPRLEILTKDNEGHGPTVRKAYIEALARGADYIFQTDSDGQTDPREFPAFWEERTSYSAQIGKRSDREDGWQRKFVSWGLRTSLKMFFHVSTEDPNTPFRLLHHTVLEEFLPLIPEEFALSNAFLSVCISYSQMTYRYLPIHFRPRQGGTNSINFKRICQIAWETVRRFPELNKVMRSKITPKEIQK